MPEERMDLVFLFKGMQNKKPQAVSGWRRGERQNIPNARSTVKATGVR